jgi:hypothetical protein
VLAFQILTVVSRPAEASSFPSGDQATAVRERGRHSGSMSMVRDRRRLRYSTSTNSKKAHKYDNTTEHQEKHIESFRLSRHHVHPFFSVQVREHVNFASQQGVRGLIFSWPTGTFYIVSVPEVGADKQDVFLIIPGRVFDSSLTWL